MTTISQFPGSLSPFLRSNYSTRLSFISAELLTPPSCVGAYFHIVNCVFPKSREDLNRAGTLEGKFSASTAIQRLLLDYDIINSLNFHFTVFSCFFRALDLPKMCFKIGELSPFSCSYFVNFCRRQQKGRPNQKGHRLSPRWTIRFYLTHCSLGHIPPLPRIIPPLPKLTPGSDNEPREVF